MKKVIITLSVLSIILAYFLFESRVEVTRLNKLKSFSEMEVAVSEALRGDEAKITIDFDCHAIRISEHFGKFFKWDIDVLGLRYEAGESYIVFRNDNKNGVLKSWFPPRESHEQGGVGNSVSIRETEYKLVLFNMNRVTRVVSYLDSIKEICD